MTICVDDTGISDITLDTTYEGSYFQRRGVSKEIHAQFGLGEVAGASTFLAERGLLRKPAFPLSSLDGNFAGWGFRADHPDYKYYYYRAMTGRTLYGLPHAIPEIIMKNEAIIVEGFFDVLLAHTLGLRNVVGVLSGVITKYQAAALASFTDRFILALDMDNPGLEGIKRSETLVRSMLPDVTVSRFLYYPHHDFCDYIKWRLDNGETETFA